MVSRIKIDGTYDKNTIVFLEELKINDFSFDLRPKSFSFIQEYALIDIIKECYRPWNKYYLHFENEKDYVIEKIIKDVKEVMIQFNEKDHLDNNLFLEFSDGLNISFYESFKTPYIFYLDERHRIDELGKESYLKAIVFPYSYLNYLHLGGKFAEFVGLFFKHFNIINKAKTIDLILSVNWNDDVFPSLFEYFNFKIISYPINNLVESSYRKVDHECLKKYLKGKI